ncbi:MAG: VapE family protein, partial [Prevotella sp.]|nr:VapE family protein [Prevotella sp.]
VPIQRYRQYAINSIAIEVQEAGIFVRDHFVERLIKSKYAKPYHPIRFYINKVNGTWDGKERISDFLRRINQSDYCQKMGRIWLRAMVAQMAGIDANHANSVMLTLVSPTQGLHKSTFLRNLLPLELRDYYTDDFSLNQKGNAQRKIVEFAIINDDELDKENPKKMPMMKTLMQTMKPSFIGAYKKNFNRLPRAASFTGTSNSRELLTDRTGSRRFLILEPDSMIDVEGIEHDQIYAQLLQEIEQGEPYYFSKADEQEMQVHNEPYYVKTDLERSITSRFRIFEAGEEAIKMSASTVLGKLKEQKVKGIENITINTFSKILTRLFGSPIHTNLGNLYAIREV